MLRCTFRIPDLVVVRAEAEGVLRPHQVVLAVEVISPGTVTVDRVVTVAGICSWVPP